MSSELWTLALVVFGPLILGKITPLISRTPKAESSASAVKARISPLQSPFQLSLLAVTLLAVGASVINLIPVQYGLDIVIPAEVISTLQSALYTLYSSSSPSMVEPLRLSLRGGFKGDLFLALKSPITIPTATLRSLLATAPSLLSLGFTGSEGQLEALLARLSSYDGRKLYLVVGEEVMTSCAFCHAGKDYVWYALPRLMVAFAWRVTVLGYLTTGPNDAIAALVNGVPRLLRTGAFFAEPKQEPTRQRWRSTAVALLLALLTLESLIIYDAGTVKVGLGRWNHWNVNLHLLRNVFFPLLALAVYCFPAQPQMSAFNRTAQKIQLAQSRVEKSIANLEAAGLARKVVLSDEGLRRSAVESAQKEESRIKSFDEVAELAAKKGVQVAKMKEVCTEAVKGVWREADGFNEQWERQVNEAVRQANKDKMEAQAAVKDSDGATEKQDAQGSSATESTTLPVT